MIDRARESRNPKKVIRVTLMESYGEIGRVPVNLSRFIHREVPLYREIENGNYVPADELESLREEKRLLEQLNIPVKYEGFHDYLQIRARGKLPSDQEKMVGKLETFIKKYEAKPPIYALVQGECPDLVKCDNLENVWANT